MPEEQAHYRYSPEPIPPKVLAELRQTVKTLRECAGVFRKHKMDFTAFFGIHGEIMASPFAIVIQVHCMLSMITAHLPGFEPIHDRFLKDAMRFAEAETGEPFKEIAKRFVNFYKQLDGIGVTPEEENAVRELFKKMTGEESP